MTRITFGLLTMLAGFLLLSTTAFTHDLSTHTPDGDFRPCFEDEVVMWDGTANAHLHCVPVDDLIWEMCGEVQERAEFHCDLTRWRG